MKINDLTNEELEIIGKNFPEWTADNIPEWMADHRPEWMADNRPFWMAYNKPHWMADRPDGMADHGEIPQHIEDFIKEVPSS